jgi:hypothetical protein
MTWVCCGRFIAVYCFLVIFPVVRGFRVLGFQGFRILGKGLMNWKPSEDGGMWTSKERLGAP